MKYLINFEVEVNDNQKPRVKLLCLEEVKGENVEPEMTPLEKYIEEVMKDFTLPPEIVIDTRLL